MTKANTALMSALEQIQALTVAARVRAPDVNQYARVLENIRHLATETLQQNADQPTYESVTKDEPTTPERMSVRDILAPAEQVLSMESIQAALTKRYPQGWVLAWAEQAPGPLPTETQWSDFSAAHGSVSQRLGLAAFLKGSIKHNIIRRNT